MIVDLKNLDRLTPEQRKQFESLLAQYPHLESKMESSRELNTPSRKEMLDDEAEGAAPQRQQQEREPAPAEEIRAEDFAAPKQPQPEDYAGRSFKRGDIPTARINPEENFFQEQARQGREESERKSKYVKEAPKVEQPPEIASFSTKGKTHPVLEKLRATLKMRTYQKPYVAELGGIKYEMIALDRQMVTKATNLALNASETNTDFTANFEVAVVAFAIQKIDDVPVEEVFSVPELDQTGEELLSIKRKELTANYLFQELLHEPNELSENLATLYQQEFPPVDLLAKDRGLQLCPVEDCGYKRVVPRGESAYCPYHGEKLAAEENIPNPS